MIIPPKHTLKQIASAWQTHIRAAADKPWLFALLTRQWARLFRRFAHFYKRLLSLPRPYKRALKRRLATTLAGAALLLTLGQALPARAATITVDGVACTLAEAIDSANNDSAAGNGCVDGNGADTLNLQTDVTLSALLPDITSNITLEGNGHTLDGNNAFGVLYVRASGDLALNDATVTGGDAANYGGGISNAGTLMVNNSTLSGNSAGLGGGIFNDNGALVVNESTMSGNSAYLGGGIYNRGGTVTVNNSALSGNSALGGGGGIFNNFPGKVTVNDSTVSGNSARYWGGGLYNTFGTVTVNNSTFSSNSVSSLNGNGGGIYTFYGMVTLYNSTLSGNSADGSNGNGGGIYNSYATVLVNNSTLSGNSTGSPNGWGGGIANTHYGELVLNNSTLSGNSAAAGGGIVNTNSTLTMNNSTLSGNSADGPWGGGGIYNTFSGSTVTLNRSLISGNAADIGAEVNNSETVNANHYNVIGYGGGARSSGFTPGANDIIPPGALATVLDTTLADNGGPTLTHDLVSGSVAMDAAPNAPCLAPPINGIDQRGFPRNVGGDGAPSDNECDSGAFEYTPVGNPTPTPTPTNTPRATLPSTPRSSPTPTRTPQAPTQTPDPRTPTRTLIPTQSPILLAIVDQANDLTTASPDRSANLLIDLVVVALATLGNLLWFRKWRS